MIVATTRRGVCAILCLALFCAATIPGTAAVSANSLQAQRALSLLGGQSCAASSRYRTQTVRQVAQVEPTDTPSPSASPVATPSFGPVLNGPAQLYATPRPQGSPVTPPPVPTPTPSPGAVGPIFLVRGEESPPPITPAGHAAPAPTAVPSVAPTLGPGDVAVLSDSDDFNVTQQGKPGYALGNVHVFYSDDELVGDKAYYDGARTIKVTGHPYVINRAKDSILQGDEIDFDTIDQTSKIVNANGTSNEGLEEGLVHFKSVDMHTDPDGVGHGKNVNVTTCENERGGYHLTGKTFQYYPGDKIVITSVILWLGAAAVFFLPRVVIPLRSIQNEAQRPPIFPEMGYDQYEGAYVKAKLGFGKDRYYYGYYRVEYFTKVGLGLGYVGFFSKKNGRRMANVNYYEIRDRRTDTQTTNLTLQDQENFSRTLRGTFNFNYTSNYGPLTAVPANTSLNASIVHSTAHSSQNYGFNRNAVGTQSSSDAFTFTDSNTLTPKLSQSENVSLTRNSSAFGGLEQSTAGAHVTTQTHYSTSAVDYLLTFDKSFSQTPSGIDKLPELQVRPYKFFPHAGIPITSQFTIGDYSEPANAFNTSRADLGFVVGPALYKVFNSDFQANLRVDQFAYGTGDLKAIINQTMSLSTPIGQHVINSLSYNEANYNGPPFVPFQFLDQQPTTNVKGAQDLLRFFNGDVYSLQLGFSTQFNAMAQPVTYQLSARPTSRSIVIIGGAFSPGPGQGRGFGTTNVQFSTPLGYETNVNFIGNVDWAMHGRIENKAIYIDKIIGDCYDIKLQYNQDSRQVNVVLDLLAFPSHSTGFAIGGAAGSLIPSNFGQ